MPVASVGGSIGINPTVKVARGLLNNPDAKTLASVLVSVGLAQELSSAKSVSRRRNSKRSHEATTQNL